MAARASRPLPSTQWLASFFNPETHSGNKQRSAIQSIDSGTCRLQLHLHCRILQSESTLTLDGVTMHSRRASRCANSHEGPVDGYTKRWSTCIRLIVAAHCSISPLLFHEEVLSPAVSLVPRELFRHGIIFMICKRRNVLNFWKD